jgi:hypothetical protein
VRQIVEWWDFEVNNTTFFGLTDPELLEIYTSRAADLVTISAGRDGEGRGREGGRSVLIKAQHNVASNHVRYAPMKFPKILPEYVVLWQRPSTRRLVERGAL